MSPYSSVMTYTVLAGVHNRLQGFIRIEPTETTLQISCHAESASVNLPLRLLLLSCGEEGAALDLGPTPVSSGGIVSITKHLPPMNLALWDAIVLAEDWPSGKLSAVGWLTDPPGPLWKLMDAAAEFLRVPPAQNP